MKFAVLRTRDDGYVTTAAMKPYLDGLEPEVVQFGQRIFVMDTPDAKDFDKGVFKSLQSEADKAIGDIPISERKTFWYRECFAGGVLPLKEVSTGQIV